MNLQENISRIKEIMEVVSEEKKGIKGLYLTFPKEGIETIGATLAKVFGVVIVFRHEQGCYSSECGYSGA